MTASHTYIAARARTQPATIPDPSASAACLAVTSMPRNVYGVDDDHGDHGQQAHSY